jgi:hypothetical protein
MISHPPVPVRIRPKASRGEPVRPFTGPEVPSPDQNRSYWLLVSMLAAHGLMGLVMHKVPAAATAHALFALVASLAVALMARHAWQLLAAAAYVSSSEVMWRMCEASVFHEVAKYAVVLLYGIGLIRLKSRARVPAAALLYFVLLMPGIIKPLVLMPGGLLRRALSFNLSGPLALFLAVFFCANAVCRWQDLWRAVPAAVCPLAGVAAITLFSTYSREAIRFTNESNFATSGGFGPNQVSSALGFGALLLLLYVTQCRAGTGRKLVMFGFGLLLLMQSAMTFSRGGLMCTGLAMVVAGPMLLSNLRYRAAFLCLVAGLTLAALLIVPRLDRFTGGKLTKRFTAVESTGRTAVAESDLRLWQTDPVFGIGVGISRFARGSFAAHTEYTRCLAEHGLFGLASVVLLLWMSVRRIWDLRTKAAADGALDGALIAWTLVYLAVNAMRTVLPAFAFGLAFISLRADSAPAAGPSLSSRS